MESTEHLKNSGMVLFGDRPSGETRTIIVLGVGRGGTSLCSKALHSLGIFTGDHSNPPIYEDIPLSRAIEDFDLAKARTIVAEYNKLHRIWAFKRPNTNNSINGLHRIVRNPIYVVIFRDILAIANRNNLSMGVDSLKTMESALSDYKLILDFLQMTSAPAILVSYEKVLKNADAFIRELIHLFGPCHQPTKEQVSAATNSIEPSPRDYLVNTSAVNYIGYLDYADTDSISGWAAFAREKVSITLELSINNVPIISFTPNVLREDVRDKGLHPDGYCGYHYTFLPSQKPEKGDVVSVKFSENGMDLRNSPLEIK